MSRRTGSVIAAGAAVVITLALILAITREEQLIGFDPEGEAPQSVNYTARAQLGSTSTDDSTSAVGELLIRGLAIEGCDPREPEFLQALAAEEGLALMHAAGEELALSNDPDLLLAAALLNDDEKERWTLVDRSLAVAAGNPVALWHQLHHCYQIGCDVKSIEPAMIAADESNGMVWLEIASDRIRKGVWDEAESALRRAVDAPRFDTYFMDHAMTVERGLAATTDLDYTERVVAGIGISAALAIPAFGDVSQACRSGGNDELIWIDLCDDLGAKMFSDSRELISTVIGQGYREAAALRAGDMAKADQLKQEARQVFSGVLRAQANSGAQALMENDPAILQRYVEYFRAHGELKAVDLLVEDARRLRADPTYDQCNFVGNPDFGL